MTTPQPGRALDARVAEAIGYEIKYYEGPYDRLFRNVNQRLPGQNWEPLHWYSTSIAAAWEVLEKLKEQGRMFTVGFDGNEYWADFTHRGTGPSWVGLVDAPTAPLAISLAALAAVEEKDGG